LRRGPTSPPIPPTCESTEASLRAASVVLLNQLRSIDRRRLVRRLGRLRPDTIKRVDRVLQISLGLAGL
jgi:mRNA interferase MazF